jgi:SAM-dependent methyltransferase
MDLEHLARLRLLELERVLPFLPEGARILELGAGSGWQARELARRGYRVEAIDLASSPYASARVHPVREFDGQRLPYADGSFDVLFSSNVLEHVRDGVALEREIARVLAPGGRAVHVLPSASWRLWTSAAQAPHVARLALGSLLGRRARSAAPAGRSPQPVRARPPLWRMCLPARHGEHGSALSELWLFARPAWRRRFRRAGWRVEARVPNRLFYTGCDLLGPRLPDGPRRALARLLGSACHLWVLRREEPGSART